MPPRYSNDIGHDFNPPEPGSGDGGTGGGGGTNVAADVGKITATGGLMGLESMVLVPMFDPEFNIRYFGTFDYLDYNTESACEYRYKEEDGPFVGRSITVSRIRILYRDLGKFKIKATVNAVQLVEGEPVFISKSATKEFGSIIPTNKIITGFLDFVITGERPQLILSREKDWGPIDIIEAAMITDVEIAEQM